MRQHRTLKTKQSQILENSNEIFQQLLEKSSNGRLDNNLNTVKEQGMNSQRVILTNQIFILT